MLDDSIVLFEFSQVSQRIRKLLENVPQEVKLRRNCCPHCELHQGNRPCVWPESMCPYMRDYVGKLRK